MNKHTISLVRELAGTTCQCGQPKLPKHSFCTGCYRALAPELREPLTRALSAGYVDAVLAAKAYLTSGTKEEMGKVER